MKLKHNTPRTNKPSFEIKLKIGLMGKLTTFASLLLGISLAGTYYFSKADAYKQYHDQLINKIDFERNLVSSLISQQAIGLRTYGEMLTSDSTIKEALLERDSDKLGKALRNFALTIPPDSGIDLFRFYDHQMTILAESGVDRIETDSDFMKNLIAESTKKDKMVDTLVCSALCRQLAVMPVYNSNGSYYGSLMLASDISSVLAEATEITGASLGIASTLTPSLKGNSSIPEDRKLNNGKLYLSEITNYPAMKSLVSELDDSSQTWFRHATLPNNGYLFEYLNHNFTIHAWPIGSQGHWAIVIFNTSKDLQAIDSRLRGTTLFSFLLVLLMIVLFSAYISQDVRRINQLCRAMPLLSANRFSDLTQSLSRIKSGLGSGDEIDKLNKAIRETANTQNELLKQRIDADERNLRKSRYLAQSAHDMRNLVSPMTALSESLKMTCKEKSSVETLRALHWCSMNLQTLSQEAIDIDRIERGVIVPNEIEFNPFNFAEEVFEATSYNAINKGLRSVLIYDEVPLRCVIADSSMIRKVLINILDNAIKYTNNGHVTLICEHKETDGNSEMLSFTVNDSGKGIPEGEIDLIFNDYHRSTDKEEGYGIGLFIARQFTRALRGQLEVISTGAEGSEFKLQVPVKRGGWLDPLGAKTKSQPLPQATSSNNKEHKATNERHWDNTYFTTIKSKEEIETLSRRLQQDGHRLVLLESSHDTRELARVSSGIIVKTREQFSQKGIEKIANILNSRSFSLANEAMNTYKRKLRILVADDSEPVSLAVCGIFETRGHHCIQAPDGISALSQLMQKEFDCAILDQQMPGMTGSEIARTHYAAKKGKGATIVLCTADTEAIKECQLAIDKTVIKPFDIQQLLSEVEILCDQKATPRKAINNQSAAQLFTNGHLGMQHEKTPSHKINSLALSDISSKNICLSKSTSTPHLTRRPPHQHRLNSPISAHGNTKESLVELVQMLGEKRAKTIISKFLDSAKSYVDDIELAMKEGDHSVVKSKLHTLIASSGTIHALNILRTAKSQQNTNNVSSSRVDVASLREAIQASEENFKAQGLL